jgi:RNA polymerase sigma-70 factor (ECF subfamily)
VGVAETTAEALVRRSYGKLVAYLAARTRDVAGAEDALSEAFAAALADWPRSGIPRAPEAWLLTVARRKLVDATRRRRVGEAATPTLALLTDELDEAGSESGIPDETVIPDERLRLMFACADPAIDASVRAPLILQVVLGFDAAAIASAFLVAPSAMAQRLVRAKSRIRQAGLAFRVPERKELGERLHAVLEAIYAIYAEGWSDPAGTQARSRGLAEEGIWLGRLVASLLPEEPEALGLLALMLHAEARRDARRDGQGEFVPLHAQDPRRWDAALIDEAEGLLFSASRIGAPGRFQLEAAVQSAHAARRLGGWTDWAAIVQLYDALLALTGSVVVAINRAVALAAHLGGFRGAAEGLAALDALDGDARLAEYQPYWAARAALLARTGRTRAAADAYQRAIGLESDPAVRRFLQAELSRARRPAAGLSPAALDSSRASLLAGRAAGGRHRSKAVRG